MIGLSHMFSLSIFINCSVLFKLIASPHHARLNAYGFIPSFGALRVKALMPAFSSSWEDVNNLLVSPVHLVARVISHLEVCHAV